MNKEELLCVQVPPSTDTYSAVPHRAIIEVVQEELDRHNLVPVNEKYNTNRQGTQVIGYMDIRHPDNSDLGMRLAFRNSYDKSMSVAFVSGASVWICSNGMISGEEYFLRKHTGSVNQELHEKVVTAINHLDEHFQRMIQHSEEMKRIELPKEEMAKLLGRMYFQENLVTSTQLNIIKKEFEEPQFEQFRDENLWSLYNHVTFSLKQAHPLNYIQQHKDFHTFVEKEFSL